LPPQLVAITLRMADKSLLGLIQAKMLRDNEFCLWSLNSILKILAAQTIRGRLDGLHGRKGITVENLQTTYFYSDYCSHWPVAARLQHACYSWRAVATAQALVRDQN